MKLLKMPKIAKRGNGVCHYIGEILKKYPTAVNEDIYATIIKAGMNCSYSNVSSAKSAYFKEKRIKELLGVK